ncbi:MAG: Gfo/Idh/MocA family oxidoreductase, partial [Caldilineaceae bacterium]|nr:Gfo/Idh/MocA family oxidoreductase [Caldilineaceae bacterium]
MTPPQSPAGTLRVGFIGTGWTDRVQIPIFRMSGLTIQAVSSGNPANAQRVAAAHDIPEVYDDWRALIASDTVDLVSVVTPPALHREIAVAALQAGKHVISEKPTALNTAEAEAMLAAAQAAPEQLAIIDHELRFDPARLHLRQLVKNGYVGTVLNIHLARLGSERLDPTQPWTWWSDAAQGGGMLNALGSHLLDLARWLGGRIDTMTAQLKTGHLYRPAADGDGELPVSADEHARLLLQFASGAAGSITVSGLTPGGYGMTVEVVGTHGALRIDNQNQLWGMEGEGLRGDWQPIRVK